MFLQYNARDRAASSTRATGSGATCSSSSTCRRAWPITSDWRGFARWVYSIREDKTLDQFVGLEYSLVLLGPAARDAAVRLAAAPAIPTPRSGIQLELKGLSSVGVDNEAFLRECDSWILRASVRAQILRCP